MFAKPLSGLSVAFLFGVFAAHAADYYVAVGCTGDYKSAGSPGPSPVAAAALATASGDVIHVGPGTYQFQTNNIFMAPGVTMIGGSDNPEETRIVRIVTGTNDRVIHVGKGGTLRNLTASGGYTDYQAAGILGYDSVNSVHKTFTVSNCVVENCSALYKGGGSLGGVWRDCVIRNCTVRNPSAAAASEGSGGGIWGGTLFTCTITNNTAWFSGGGIAGNAADPCVANNCTIGWNTAPYGGGAAAPAAISGCRLVGCTVISNSAHRAGSYTWGGSGGGAYSAVLTNCLVTCNYASYYPSTGIDVRGGGGLADAIAYDCDIVANWTTAMWGGGGYTSGGGAYGGYLENCRILNNSSYQYGGGCTYTTNVNCIVAGNSATIGGGALRCLFRNCVLSNNVARTGQGGAAYYATTFNCLVAFNTSQLGSTLFRGYHEGDLIVSNRLVSASEGSALAPQNAYVLTNCDVVEVNCTIVGNTGGEGGAYAAHMTNCIVVGHATDVKWPSLTVRSLWQTGDAKVDPSCMVGVDPKFVKVPGKGECAYSLLRGSPCRDKGLLLPWMANATDLLGNPRVKFGAVDLGAFECVDSGGTIITIL